MSYNKDFLQENKNVEEQIEATQFQQSFNQALNNTSDEDLKVIIEELNKNLNPPIEIPDDMSQLKDTIQNQFNAIPPEKLAELYKKLIETDLYKQIFEKKKDIKIAMIGISVFITLYAGFFIGFGIDLSTGNDQIRKEAAPLKRAIQKEISSNESITLFAQENNYISRKRSGTEPMYHPESLQISEKEFFGRPLKEQEITTLSMLLEQRDALMNKDTMFKKNPENRYSDEHNAIIEQLGKTLNNLYRFELNIRYEIPPDMNADARYNRLIPKLSSQINLLQLQIDRTFTEKELLQLSGTLQNIKSEITYLTLLNRIHVEIRPKPFEGAKKRTERIQDRAQEVYERIKQDPAFKNIVRHINEPYESSRDRTAAVLLEEKKRYHQRIKESQNPQASPSRLQFRTIRHTQRGNEQP